jgi:hypothetical protein
VTARAIAALALLAALVVAAPVLGAEGDIEPDRPDTTNGAKTLAPGAVQIETGVEYSRARQAGSAVEKRFVLDTLGRVGVVERLELQVGWQPLVRLRGDEDDSGGGDVTLAAKARFFDGTGPWPALGTWAFVKLPAADEPIGSGRLDLGAVLIASFDLPAGFGVDVNAGAAAIGQGRPSGFVVQPLTSAALSVEIGPALPFVELVYAGRGDRDGRDAVSLATGFVYRLGQRVALDVAAQTSVAGDAPDWVLRAGVSVRFGR